MGLKINIYNIKLDTFWNEVRICKWWNLHVLVAGTTSAILLYQVYMHRQKRHKVKPERKAVLITGCDTGFGHALALRLKHAGFWVYAGCLNSDSKGAITLREQDIKVLQLDVTKQDQVDDVMKEINTNEEQELHAVVNNAGMVCFGEVELLPMDMYERIMDVNYLGTVRVTKACLPMLRKSRGSRVVNVASLMGNTALYNLSAYCGSKFAMEAFSSVLRQEMVKWGIHVSVIEPGPYNTSERGVNVSVIEPGPYNTGIGVGEINSYINTLWDKSSPEAKRDYGKDYFNAYASCDFPDSDNINEAIDAMADAVQSALPQKCYRIGIGSALLPLITWLCPSLWDHVPEYLLRRYTFYTGKVPAMLQ